MQNRPPTELREYRAAWVERFRATRAATEALASGLNAEDQTIQSMPDASPTKWHLAHTTWFFETFVLAPSVADYRPFAPAFGYLFNSYYEAVGPRHPRPQRGLLSRPAIGEVLSYRDAITTQVAELIESIDAGRWEQLLPIVELGLNHEEQHQELILMDIKHAFSANPLEPVYRPRPMLLDATVQTPLHWVGFPGGLVEIGATHGFAFDNEGPPHKLWLEPYRLAHRLVTCGEYLDFMLDGGYRRPELWLSEGWQAVLAQNWRAPLYWREDDATWSIFTLAGRRPLDRSEPVVHVSYYEADAFARWSGHRLPREGEWEIAAQSLPLAGNLLDSGRLHPAPALKGETLSQMIGDVWEWTESAYAAYPGFRAAAGAIGEYNGKFMSGQMVLRGGAAVTPAGHIRRSYRNFFPPAARWPFSGIRLAEDAS
jgi:ergothioneine biosynthesis protein EgtB